MPHLEFSFRRGEPDSGTASAEVVRNGAGVDPQFWPLSKGISRSPSKLVVPFTVAPVLDGHVVHVLVRPIGDADVGMNSRFVRRLVDGVDALLGKAVCPTGEPDTLSLGAPSATWIPGTGSWSETAEHTCIAFWPRTLQ